MKRYLLLASVAGCLLSAGNAMAEGGIDDNNHGATMDITATIAAGVTGQVWDMTLGTIVVKSIEGPASGDELLTISDGVITPTDNIYYIGETSSTGRVTISSGGDRVTGVSFSPTTVDLKDSENNVLATVTDFAVHGEFRGSEAPIDATVKLGSDWGQQSDSLTEISGSTTITFQF